MQLWHCQERWDQKVAHPRKHFSGTLWSWTKMRMKGNTVTFTTQRKFKIKPRNWEAVLGGNTFPLTMVFGWEVMGPYYVKPLVCELK